MPVVHVISWHTLWLASGWLYPSKYRSTLLPRSHGLGYEDLTQTRDTLRATRDVIPYLVRTPVGDCNSKQHRRACHGQRRARRIHARSYCSVGNDLSTDKFDV